uniref:Serine/threonine-protein kinase nek2 n=1 Tax=Cucumis melo TaxID=3656 RepID=A0A9I9E6U2_CUCME
MFDVTRIRSLGDKKVVKYNKDGAPIGENGAKLKSFIGSTTHYHVPITYTSWKSVPVKLKDKIFTTVEAAFVIDPRSRKNVLQTAGRVCKVKEKRQLQQDRRSKNKYNHRISRKGYANLKEEMLLIVKLRSRMLSVFELSPVWYIRIDMSLFIMLQRIVFVSDVMPKRRSVETFIGEIVDLVRSMESPEAASNKKIAFCKFLKAESSSSMKMRMSSANIIWLRAHLIYFPCVILLKETNNTLDF